MTGPRCPTTGSRLLPTLATVAVLFHVPLQAVSQTERPDDSAAVPQHFGFGRAATAEEVAAWDIDVRPDGKGLGPGEGSVTEGRQLYQALCAVCHGASGVEGPNDRLVVHSPDEPFPDANDADSWQHRTIGNYWPYATTLYDYIYRAMPQNIPGSLSPQQTYSLTAYLLFLNGLIDEDQRLNANNLPQIEMPARDRFVVDDRLEYDVVR